MFCTHNAIYLDQNRQQLECGDLPVRLPRRKMKIRIIERDPHESVMEIVIRECGLVFPLSLGTWEPLEFVRIYKWPAFVMCQEFEQIFAIFS